MAAIPDHLRAEVDYYRNFPRERPDNIVIPQQGQESVWDYPRPPRLERVFRPIRILCGGIELVRTERAVRVAETSSPPCYYVPPSDVQMQHLKQEVQTSLCEWKGVATYWAIQIGETTIPQAAWSYAEPFDGYTKLQHYLAFYPAKMDACFIGDVLVQPQPGQYYGGWVTPELTGPFKGVPGSEKW